MPVGGGAEECLMTMLVTPALIRRLRMAGKMIRAEYLQRILDDDGTGEGEDREAKYVATVRAIAGDSDW